MFKDFSSTDNKDKMIKFSEIVKTKKYVLLDFWASWCAPCRAENHNILKVYNDYKNKGFEVVAFSIDAKKDLWLKAVKEDGMPWIHLSDSKGSDSEVSKLYAVSAVPMNFLIDSEGKIIATELRGKSLQEKLEQLYKEQ